MNQDPRLTQLVEISGPGPRRVVGVASGGADAALNRSVRDVARAMSELRTKAAEIRSATNMLPSEQVARLDMLKAPALKAARQHQHVLDVESQRISNLAKTASPVKTSAQVPLHVVLEDQLLVTRFAGMSISERTQVTARAMSDPAANLRWVEMLLRLDPVVTGIDAQMYQQLRQSALEALDPEMAANIQAQEEQVEFAQRALDLVKTTLGEELPGSIVELDNMPAESAMPIEDPLSRLPQHVIDDLRSGGRRPAPLEIDLALNGIDLALNGIDLALKKAAQQ